MLKTIALIIIVLVAGVLGFAATRPDSFSVERKIVVKAPPDKIYPLVSDFHGWKQWSPWEKLDPNMKATYSGAASGKGAIYEWQGDSKVGAGRMEIVDVTAPSQIGIQLDFLKPIEGRNHTEFTFAPQGESTQVTWRMSGPSPYVSKVMGVFVSMDKMIGGDFETGLAQLKAAAEK